MISFYVYCYKLVQINNKLYSWHLIFRVFSPQNVDKIKVSLHFDKNNGALHEEIRWSKDSVLAVGTRVRGFAPGRSRQIFKAKKILSTPSFGGEVNPSVPCRSFTACKRSLNVTSAFRQNYRTFLAHSSTFRRWVLSRGDTCGDAWWQKLERLAKIAQ